MVSALLWLAAGVVIGGGVAYVLATPTHDAGSPGSPGAQPVPLLTRLATLVAGNNDAAPRDRDALTAAGHREAYREAMQASDVDAVQGVLRRIAGEPASAATELRAAAWLARYSELDPARAAMFAHRSALADHLIVQAFQSWCDVDPDAALTELARIGDAMTRRAVAVGLLDVFGHDVAGIERIAVAMPVTDRVSFQVNATAALARHDAGDALRAAMILLSGNAQRRAIQLIAGESAQRDPRGAVEQAGLLPDDLAMLFRNAVTLDWARMDGEGYLAWMTSGITLSDDLLPGLLQLVASAPERVLDVVDQLPAQFRPTLRRQAFSELASRDPHATIARMQQVPPGMERDQLLQAVAVGFANTDPDGAIAWVEQLQPPSSSAYQAVLISLAQRHPDRALDMLLQPSPGLAPGHRQQLVASLSLSLNLFATDLGRLASMADRLLHSDQPMAADALQSVVSGWAQRDTEAALDWMLANRDRIDPAAFSGVGGVLADRDVMAAAAFLDRLPAEVRPAWLAQVAGAYANHDLDAAVNWIAQYQGQDGYDVAYRQVIARAASQNPQAAATLLDRADAESQLGLASQVARSWSNEDPAAASAWAQTIRDPRARVSATAVVASAWAARDATAAKRWALAMPGGDARDQALSALLIASANAGTPDRSLLDEFDSVQNMEQGAALLARLVGARSPDEAHELLDAYVSDPELRQRTAEQIDTGSRQPALAPGGLGPNIPVPNIVIR